MLRSLPQCGACDLVWEEQLLLFPWAKLKTKNIDYTELKFQRNLAKFAKKNVDYTELIFQRNLAKSTNGRKGTKKRRD